MYGSSFLSTHAHVLTPNLKGNILREYASLSALYDGLDDMSDFNLSDEDEETLVSDTVLSA